MCFVPGLIDSIKFVAVDEERKLTVVAGKSRTTRGIRRGNWPGLHIFAEELANAAIGNRYSIVAVLTCERHYQSSTSEIIS